MNAIDVVLDNPFTDDMPALDFGRQLTTLRHASKVVKQRLEALEELAMHHITTGETIPGFMVDQTTGNTRYRKNVTPEFVEALTGRKVGKTVLPSVSEIRAMGLGETVIKSLTERSLGKPKLVAVSEDAMARRMLGLQ